MQAGDSVALVTGANRGIGRGFVEELLARGARRVYATARQASSLAPLVALDASRVVALPLDVTSDADVDRAAEATADVDLLVNNAGVTVYGGLIGAPGLEGARLEMETNYWGPLRMCRAFAPVLGRNGGGAIINVLSVGAMACFPQVGSYCASKFAAAAMTQGVRLELAAQRTLVMGVYTGSVATDMSARTPGDKITPREHARLCLDALEAGVEDLYPDPKAKAMHAEWLADPKAFERGLLSRLK
jgi:NAD(P)-dependent dehydrogenase (short-subunit alcohol dehydrogenase family)